MLSDSLAAEMLRANMRRKTHTHTNLVRLSLANMSVDFMSVMAGLQLL